MTDRQFWPITVARKTYTEMMTHHGTRVEAAHLLNRSTRTIEDHRARIMGKLDVDNIVDLVKRVVKMGG